MRLSPDEARHRAAGVDHGVLSTARGDGAIDSVPACFAIDGDRLAVPIDEVKPKATTTLQRVRNLRADPRATLLCEHWDAADWSRLWWVRLRLRLGPADAGTIDRLADTLRSRYPHYAATTFREVLVFDITSATGWSAR
jgi:hypothetical protein